MSDGMGRELAYLSSHATNRYFIPNWGIEMILDSFSLLPDEVEHLVNNRLPILSYSADFSVFFEKD